MSSVFIPKFYQDAMMYPKWKQAMDEEMDVLISRYTWDLVPTSPRLPVISSHWVFTVKYCPDGTVDRCKACLVAAGFTQTYAVDYLEMSPIARLNSIHVLFSLTVNQQWPMFQLDVKNTFMYVDLNQEVVWRNLLDMLLRERI